MDWDKDEEYLSDLESEDVDVGILNDEEENMLASSDSDGAPDDVSFRTGREHVLQRLKNTREQIQRQKQEKKSKRKEQTEQYILQKKIKIEELSKKRLSDDILDEIVSVPHKTKYVTQTELYKESKITTPERITTDEAKVDLGEDYIPLEENSESIKVVAINDSLKKTSRQAPSDFKQKSLYGSRVTRESVKQMLAKKQKRKARNL